MRQDKAPPNNALHFNMFSDTVEREIRKGEMMRVILPLVIDFEAADWATEYGLAELEAAGDFASTMRRAVSEDGIRRAIDDAWPMMGGHIAVHTPDQLDPALRDELLEQLRDARDADLD